MKIRSHAENHTVELEDGSRRRIFPGDLDATLDWTPETELAVVAVDDQVSARALATVTGGLVHVLPADEPWPVQNAKSILKDG
jgi:hypothetical protein